MNITCPACGKTGQTAATCQRCACDLSRLQALAQAAGSHLRAARLAVEQRNYPSGLARAEQSWRLCSTFESARLAFLAAAADGDTDRALLWRRRVQEG